MQRAQLEGTSENSTRLAQVLAPGTRSLTLTAIASESYEWPAAATTIQFNVVLHRTT